MATRSLWSSAVGYARSLLSHSHTAPSSVMVRPLMREMAAGLGKRRKIDRFDMLERATNMLEEKNADGFFARLIDVRFEQSLFKE